jgi:hypothetical protein
LNQYKNIRPRQSRRTGLILFCGLICCFVSLTAQAQEISAKASAPKNEYVVGERIDIIIELKRPKNFTVAWKKTEFESDNFELSDSISTDSVVDKKFIRSTIHLPMGGFDSGKMVFPEQVFIFRKEGDTTPFVINTRPVEFHISTITINPDKDIKPVVEPARPGVDWLKILEYWLLYILIIGIIALIIILYLRNRKREKNITVQHPAIKRPPWEIAIENLALLQKENLPASGEVKAYYTRLSNITRQFISEILLIDAIELTTEELLEKLNAKKYRSERIGIISEILELSDSVKFAKYHPDDNDHARVMKLALELVEAMRNDYIYLAETRV